MSKDKIQKTNRVKIRTPAGTSTIYCSYRIIQEIRPLCYRLEQNVMVPLRDKNWDVVAQLSTLARNMPDHFPASSRVILGA